MSALANQLTVLRVAIIPLLVLFFYWPALWAGYAVVALFVVAAITDWFDGYIARRLNQTSGFGAFLDPVADKLIVTTSLALITLRFPEGAARTKRGSGADCEDLNYEHPSQSTDCPERQGQKEGAEQTAKT